AGADERRRGPPGAYASGRKPFEASVLLSTVQPLIEKPETAIASQPAGRAAPLAPPTPATAPRPVDREQVRAAVILALEASMITMIENITDKVVVALEADTRPKL